jgi:hypothetical protein
MFCILVCLVYFAFLSFLIRSYRRAIVEGTPAFLNVYKISSLNIRSLHKHFKDLQNDAVLQKSDIICLGLSG